jgi:stearoyl-CoA desaturase (Delta-9 desaturase)
MQRFFQQFCILLHQWWDADYHPEGAAVVRAIPDKVDWKRCVPFIILHLGCLLVFAVGVSWTAVGIAAGLYVVRMFAITAFYHRYFAHRAFSTSRVAQWFFAVLGNTACQRGALWWASSHRHHHLHADEEEDLHSPGVQGFWWSHIGWITSRRNFPTDYNRVKDWVKYPELVFLNRHDQLVPWFYGLSLGFVGWFLGKYFPSLHTSGKQVFVWGFFISTVALLHGTLFINSLAHVFGRRRFATEDDSRNSLLLAVITLGEGWHNNHHRYQHAARQGFMWWEFDPSYYGLKILSWCGLIWDLKAVPGRVYEEAAQSRG